MQNPQKTVFFRFWFEIKPKKSRFLTILHQPFTFFVDFESTFLSKRQLKTTKIVEKVKGNANPTISSKSTNFVDFSTFSRKTTVFRRKTTKLRKSRKTPLLYSLFFTKIVSSVFPKNFGTYINRFYMITTLSGGSSLVAYPLFFRIPRRKSAQKRPKNDFKTINVFNRFFRFWKNGDFCIYPSLFFDDFQNRKNVDFDIRHFFKKVEKTSIFDIVARAFLKNSNYMLIFAFTLHFFWRFFKKR